MTTTIRKSDGSILINLLDGSLDIINSSLNLPGRNYEGYGEHIVESLVHLLENFASSSSPRAPLAGQIWYDSSVQQLKVYTGSGFKGTAVTVDTAKPTSSAPGDLWFDSTNNQLFVYNGTQYILLGPTYASDEGKSGVETLNFKDDNGISRTITHLYSQDVWIGSLSPADFDSTVSINGLTSFVKGINLGENSIKTTGQVYSQNQFANLGEFPSAALYSGMVAVAENTGQVYIARNGSWDLIMVNSDGYLTLSGSANMTNATIQRAQVTNLRVTNYEDGILNAGTAELQAGSNRGIQWTYSDNSRTLFLGYDRDANEWSLASNATVNPNNYSFTVSEYGNLHLNNIIGTSISALYADLAENYEADKLYEFGTVVVFGGDKEVTASTFAGDNRVAGVISKEPAVLMNKDMNAAIVVPVALQGRVFVRVIGPVRKGDMMVSAPNGCAQSSVNLPKIGSVIGKSLVTDANTRERLIEVAVGRL